MRCTITISPISGGGAPSPRARASAGAAAWSPASPSRRRRERAFAQPCPRRSRPRPLAWARRRVDQAFPRGPACGRVGAADPRADGAGAARDLRRHRFGGAARRPRAQLRRRRDRDPAGGRVRAALGVAPSAGPAWRSCSRSSSAGAWPATRRSCGSSSRATSTISARWPRPACRLRRELDRGARAHPGGAAPEQPGADRRRRPCQGRRLRVARRDRLRRGRRRRAADRRSAHRPRHQRR